jgi:hypothetical protein
VIAYDCGVDQTEFKELAGRVERIKELVALLRAMPHRKLQEDNIIVKGGRTDE